MAPKLVARFSDNTAEARRLKELLESGKVTGNEKPSNVRAAYIQDFEGISSKAFGDKFRKIAKKFGMCYYITVHKRILTYSWV